MNATRAGLTLVEALVGIIVSAVIATAAATLFVAQTRFTTHAIDTAESLDALRVATGVLSGEARALTAEDFRAVASDSVAFRAFRGAGATCLPSANGGTVRYRATGIPIRPRTRSSLWRAQASARCRSHPRPP